MDTLLVESYFEWLASEAMQTQTKAKMYEGVLRTLHDIPFYWTMVSDDNRAGDALSFRQYEFLNFQTGLDDMDQVALGQWATAAPSVLEVLLGIARRWSYYYGEDPWLYFRHLFENLGFQGCHGRELTLDTQQQIRERIDIWMSRQFQPDGNGSPFPIRREFWDGHTDMTHVDIWGQMNAYASQYFW